MIEITSLVKRFDTFTALDNINLSIPKGSAYGLIGSNGAGKSTLLRLLSGVYRPDGGLVKINGERVYDNPSIKGRIFFVNDETVQYNNYTLKELVKMYSLFYDNFSRDMLDELRGVVNLPLDRKLSTFSKGMKRQAALILGLSCRTEYLFLDEVFDGLDPTMRIIVKKMMQKSLSDNSITVILSSHNLREIDELCGRAGLVHKGKLVFDRELDNIKGNINKIQAAFDTEVTADDFPDIEIINFSLVGSVVNIIAKGEYDELETKLSRMSPKVLDILPLSLEEIFIHELEGLGYEYNLDADDKS